MGLFLEYLKSVDAAIVTPSQLFSRRRRQHNESTFSPSRPVTCHISQWLLLDVTQLPTYYYTECAPMPLAISTSMLPETETFETSLITTRDDDKVDVSSCLDHLYVPHGRYSRLCGRKLRCLGKGVLLRGEHLFQSSRWFDPKILAFT
jgi:hypothetical protein